MRCQSSTDHESNGQQTAVVARVTLAAMWPRVLPATGGLPPLPQGPTCLGAVRASALEAAPLASSPHLPPALNCLQPSPACIYEVFCPLAVAAAALLSVSHM